MRKLSYLWIFPEITPFPRKRSYPQPSHLFTEIDEVLHANFKEKYIQQPCARSRIARNGRGVCCASAICSTCPVNAKFTIENSGFEVYEDPRVELMYGAQVVRLDTEGKTAKGVVYIKDGKEYTAAGEVIALGANAIFNAHILLNSGDPLEYTGKGLGEQAAIQVDVHLEDLKNTGGSTWVNAIGYMLYDGEHRKESAACLMESGNHTFLRIESGKWRNMASYRVIFEDLPLDHNQVKLSEDQQKPAIEHHGHSDYVEKGIERFKQKFPEVLSCLPVEEIIYRGKHPTESHILGSTRMSHSSDNGVVDKNLVHHHYRNVFVLGSGSFASYTPANPTLTLSALSLHAADKSF